MRHTTHEPFGQPFKNSRRQAPAITRGISAKSRRSSRTTRAESLMKRLSFRFRTPPKQKKNRWPATRRVPATAGTVVVRRRARKCERTHPIRPSSRTEPWLTLVSRVATTAPLQPSSADDGAPPHGVATRFCFRPTTRWFVLVWLIGFAAVHFANRLSIGFGSALYRGLLGFSSPLLDVRVFFTVFFGRLQVSPYSIRSTGFLPGFLGNFFDFCGFARFLLGYTAFYWVNPVCK